jgi:hypothetical protein
VTAPIVFQPEHDGSLPLESAVGQAVGAASMCWEHVDRAGVFDDQRARAVADALLAYLRGGGDLLQQVRDASARAAKIRASWNQDDRYGPDVRVDRAGDLLELAWTIIANAGVHGEGWEGQHPTWVQAAIRWRNAYHDMLPRTAVAGSDGAAGGAG